MNENFLNFMKSVYQKLMVIIFINGEKLDTFFLNSRNKQALSHYHYFVAIVTGILATAVSQSINQSIKENMR